MKITLRVTTVVMIAAIAFPGVMAEELTPETPAARMFHELGFKNGDWPWWRGPGGNGIAAAGQEIPADWSVPAHTAWMAELPGRGHGSPIVVGQRLFLQTADEVSDSQLVLCYNVQTGEQLWSRTLFSSGIARDGNKKATQASSTPACDGERLFVNFLNSGSVKTTALSLEGEILWQTRICDYVVHQGYGSSPAVHGPLVLVSADNKGPSGGVVAGLDRATGKIVWRHSRPATPNYSSPVVVHANGQDQCILTGCDRVTSYDPSSGAVLWEFEGATTECVTTTVTDGTRIYSTGGYPKNHVAAMRADGSGTVDWENNSRVYVPSMIIADGFLYAVMDAGVAVCWNAATGEEQWKGRLAGTFSSSPVLVGDQIYAVNEKGDTFTFSANPDRFTPGPRYSLKAEVLSTPTICGNTVYLRKAVYSGEQRQEILQAIRLPTN